MRRIIDRHPSDREPSEKDRTKSPAFLAFLEILERIGEWEKEKEQNDPALTAKPQKRRKATRKPKAKRKTLSQ